MEAKIWNYSGWINDTEPKKLKNVFSRLLKEAGFNVLGEIDHTFKPQGYSILFLLAESHFGVHTFPEEGASYIELSSCNEEKLYNFMNLLPFEFDILITDPEQAIIDDEIKPEETEEPEKVNADT